MNADYDSLELLYEWVGSTEVTVLLTQGWHAYIAVEQGGLMFNERATQLIRAEGVMDALILGDAVFLGSADDPLEHDCPVRLIAWMTEMYGSP